MKKLVASLLVVFTSAVYAQSTQREDLEVIQGIYGKSKKELAVAYMDIPEAQSAVFWKVYDEFESERKMLGKAKMAVINEYVTNLDNLTDETADKVAKAGLKNNMDYQKLFSKYYDKYKKVVGAVTAAKIMQFENYMQNTVQSELQEAIPFIGELEATKM